MGEYVRYEEGGAVHNNSAESYFTVFKRGMKGVLSALPREAFASLSRGV